MDYDDLRAKAEAATPGPWEANAVSVWHECDPEPPFSTAEWCGCGEVEHIGVVWPNRTISSDDAQFIATANPQTVLALLDRVEELEAEKAQMRGMVQRALPTLIAEAQADLAALGEDTE